MSNEPKPPMAFNKSEGIRAEVQQIDWGSHSVFVTYPNPDGGMRIGDFWDFSECEILPFVCPDKNGDKVFAGDKVTYQLPNWKNKSRRCHVTEFRPPFYGYGLTADDDSDYTAEGFYPSEIELIKEDDE